MGIAAALRVGRLAMAMAVALALVAGGGHREARPAPDAALAAFLAAGGALSDLCLDGGGHGGAARGGHCDACQPTFAAPLQLPSRLAARRVAQRARAGRLRRAPRRGVGHGRRGRRRPRSPEPRATCPAVPAGCAH